VKRRAASNEKISCNFYKPARSHLSLGPRQDEIHLLYLLLSAPVRARSLQQLRTQARRVQSLDLASDPLPAFFPALDVVRAGKLFPLWRSAMSAVAVREHPLLHRPLAVPFGYESCKPVLDIVAASLLLVVAAPVIALLGLLVKLTSRGPAIYSQMRLGKQGRPFRIYKLRTMTQDCERLSGPCWASADDPRVAPLGQFLRRSHLDELPQLWNVLRGDMSLVGPRPERPEIVPRLTAALPGYRDRLAVKPGVTGLAQVRLPADTDLESVRRKLAYDRYYLRCVNPWLDAQLMLCTAGQLFGVPYAWSCALLGVPGHETVGLREMEPRRERMMMVPVA
jgi:lipopolysaccharide/colanic/teichoic acid biosynthesis glycosyltransferase